MYLGGPLEPHRSHMVTTYPKTYTHTYTQVICQTAICQPFFGRYMACFYIPSYCLLAYPTATQPHAHTFFMHCQINFFNDQTEASSCHAAAFYVTLRLFGLVQLPFALTLAGVSKIQTRHDGANLAWLMLCTFGFPAVKILAYKIIIGSVTFLLSLFETELS